MSREICKPERRQRNREELKAARPTLGSFKAELVRSAELALQINEEQGFYYALSLIHDIGYDRFAVGGLLDILKEMPEATKKR